MNDTQITLDPLAPRMEEALILSGKAASAWGYVYFGDPAFVSKMRKGRKFRAKTAAKVEAVLKEIGC